jgi:ketosteroid isomerase-like protein
MSHAELLQRHLQNAGKPRTEQDGSIYTDDLVVEFPYAPDEHTRRLEGPEACMAFFSRISSFAEGFVIGQPTMVSEGDKFIAEYHGSATFKSTGLPYEQDYVLVATVRNGKLSSLKEHYDPLRVLRAMGEIP